MKEITKNLYSQFLDNGGTTEEFWAGRIAALKQAEARRVEHAASEAANRRDRITDLMERGYSRFEAEEKLRLEALEAHDAMGGNPAYKGIKREVVRYRRGVMAF